MKCFQILWLILRLGDNLIRFKETNETCSKVQASGKLSVASSRWTEKLSTHFTIVTGAIRIGKKNATDNKHRLIYLIIHPSFSPFATDNIHGFSVNM